MRIGTEVKIRTTLENYSYDENLPCLKPGSRGYVTGIWQHPWRYDETWYIVKLKCGEFPFYKTELLEI